MLGIKFEKPLQNDTIVSYEERKSINEKGETITVLVPVEKLNDAPNTRSKYVAAARWCNESGNATIEDKGDYYEVVAIPAPSVEAVREQKLSELDSSFMDWYESGATVTSSLGFVADSDSRAIMDIDGLVVSLEAQPAETRSTVAFMDAKNEAHSLTLDQLKTLRLEVIQNGQEAYAQKWALRTQIESAESVEALQAIEIVFTGLDFYNENQSVDSVKAYSENYFKV